MTLANAELEKEYSVKAIQSDDSEFVKYLFSLGCYTEETVTVISIEYIPLPSALLKKRLY